MRSIVTALTLALVAAATPALAYDFQSSQIHLTNNTNSSVCTTGIARIYTENSGMIIFDLRNTSSTRDNTITIDVEYLPSSSAAKRGTYANIRVPKNGAATLTRTLQLAGGRFPDRLNVTLRSCTQA